MLGGISHKKELIATIQLLIDGEAVKTTTYIDSVLAFGGLPEPDADEDEGTCFYIISDPYAYLPSL